MDVSETKASRIWLVGVCWIGRGQKPQSVVMTAAGDSEDAARSQAISTARPWIGEKVPRGGVGVVTVELLPGSLREMLARSEAYYQENGDES